MTIMPLQNIIDTIPTVSNSGKIYNTDPSDIKWKQLISDHKYEIIKKSTSIDISPERMVVFKYDISRFLTSIGVSKQYIWIVRFINDAADNDITFNEEISSMIIPNPQYILDLYGQFMVDSSR